MTRVLVFALIILSTVTASGQNFEGKITYSNSFKSKTPQMSDQQMKAMMGGIQEYYIKDGNYKSVINGSFLQWHQYVKTENKFYSKISNSETVFWNDAMINKDSVLSINLTGNIVKILDYDCQELVLTCKNGIQKYYFNSSLKADPSQFKMHKFGNWYAYLKESKSLPLKMVFESAQFTLESIATEVKEMNLNDSDFELPENIKTAKSPF